MKSLMPRLLLGISGALLLVIGTALLLQPHAFFAANGIILGNEPGLLSEVRAPGGLLIGCAVVLLIGVFRAGMTKHALFLAALVYGLYGLSRMISILFDGVPSSSLIGAMVSELIIGALSVFALPRFNADAATTDARQSDGPSLSRPGH